MKTSTAFDLPFAIAASHPTDEFDGATASLLTEAAGAPVICVNVHDTETVLDAPLRRRLEVMVDEIEAERQRRGSLPWVFWGMSGGGWLGQIYARKFPEAVAGLILESTCSCFRVRLADASCILSPFNEAWRTTLDAHRLIAAQSHDEVGDFDATEWTEIEGVVSVFRRTGGPALLAALMPIGSEMKRTMPALWSFDARDWLSALRLPTLVMCGSADPVVPVSHARALCRAIPGAELAVIEGAGHVPTALRRPEAAEAVTRFLRKLRH